MNKRNRHINTTCIQGGWQPKNGESRVLPIYQSTTFKYDSSDAMGELFDLKAEGFFYSRLANPTVDAVEKKITELEGGVGAMLTSSGQAASMTSVMNIALSGDHIVASAAVYGGTFNLFNKTLRELGIDVTFINPDASEEELEKAIKSNTKAVFTETIANPSLIVADIERFATVAHRHNIPLIVDNTFATPINCRPFEFGADIIVHSTTKYMDGHAVALGGCLVDSGNFDWTKGNFPMLTTPDETYHGLVYAEAFKNAAYITKAKVHLMRDMGVMMSPQNAFYLNLGLETLFLRMDRHCENALKVAEFLENDDRIASVNYPSLKSSKYYNLTNKYCRDGKSCGVISFEINGGRQAAVKFMGNLKLAAIVTHVADARTCVLHPASSTHRQLSNEQLKEAGISDGLIRLSVGIEYIDDIINDLKQALDNM